MIMNLGVHKFLLVFLLIFSFSIKSEPIAGNIAIIQVLDKITAKVVTLEININQTYQFQSLKIEIYACYKKPPEETPDNFLLIRVIDKSEGDKFTTIYKGWMISSSPSATPLEHPIYDLWLKDCKIEIDF
tara:strand:+ start:21 stop:410 length:390 start_codon:yes stop_codon:yes gene_type:complete